MVADVLEIGLKEVDRAFVSVDCGFPTYLTIPNAIPETTQLTTFL